MRRRWTGLAALVALLLLGLLFRAGTPADARPDTRGPSPSASWLGRTATLPSPPPTADAPEDTAAEPADYVRSTVVVVHLHEPGEVALVFPRHARLDPVEFWPLEGEAPFPEGAAAAGLQDLIRTEADAGSEAELAWLDTAWQEGLDPATLDVEDPWTAVLALEVARRDARADQLLAFEEALAAGEGPENGFIRPEALVGPIDTQVQASLADDLVARWPEHPAAEYGRLYQLAAAAQGADPDAGRALALDLLRHSDDALVVGQAVGLLTTLPRGEHVVTDDLDTLARFVDDHPELVDPLELSAFALDQALLTQDAARTRAWLRRFEGALETACPPTDLDLETARCLTHLDNRDEVVATVGDVHPSEARTWRQAFEIAGYHCAREGHDAPLGALRATVHWREGTWTWDGWDPGSTPFGACFERAATSGPTPDEDRLDVNVSLVRG